MEVVVSLVNCGMCGGPDGWGTGCIQVGEEVPMCGEDLVAGDVDREGGVIGVGHPRLELVLEVLGE